MGGKDKKPEVTVMDTRLSPAQQTMKQDAAELSREGRIQEGAEASVQAILAGAPKKLRLHPNDWALVRQLVRQGVKRGIQLERDL